MAVTEITVPGGLGLMSRVLPRNARSIQAALPLNGRRTVYKVAGVTGLRLHVLPAPRQGGFGAAWRGLWYVHYRLRTGRQKAVQHPIGSRETMSLEAASARAHELIGIVRDKKRDPRAEELSATQEQQLSGLTFSQLFHDWLELYAKRNLKSWEQARDKLELHALPVFGDMRLADIQASDVNRLLDRLMSMNKGVQANRVRAHLSAVFNWGASRNYGYEYNPVALTRRPQRHERPRDTVYDHGEIRALWQAIETEAGGFSKSVGLVWQLALVTGQRKSEIVGASMSELYLDTDCPTWNLPRERTKGARAHIIPLSPLAVRLFREAVGLGDVRRRFVFQSASPRLGSPHLAPHSVSQALSRCRERIGLNRHQTVHDLRHTMNTEMARLGVTSEVRARILNHAKKGITDSVYNAREYEPAMREALTKWSYELLRIVGDTPGRLTSIMGELDRPVGVPLLIGLSS